MRSEALRYIEIKDLLLTHNPPLELADTIDILAKPVSQPDGTKLHWRDLSKRVTGFESGQDLSLKIRNEVRNFTGANFPEFRQAIEPHFPVAPAKEEAFKKKLLNALVNNWVTDFGDDIEDRDDVLLSHASHVVSRIENKAYRDVLQRASDADLRKLGLSKSQRDLTVALLEMGNRADPLYTRFLAFGYLTDDPPKKADETTMFIPADQKTGKFSGKEKPVTFPAVFPKESRFLSERFEALARTPDEDAAHYLQLRQQTQERVAALSQQQIDLTVKLRQIKPGVNVEQELERLSAQKDRESQEAKQRVKSGLAPIKKPAVPMEPYAFFLNALWQAKFDVQVAEAGLQEAAKLPDKSWQKELHGPLFREYLQTLAQQYREKDSAKMAELQERVNDLESQLLQTAWPIVLHSGSESGEKEPYNDPEFHLSIRTPDMDPCEAEYKQLRAAFADSLGAIELQQYANLVRQKPVKSVIAIGTHGTGERFNTLAREHPEVVVYHNDHARFDKNYHKVLGLMNNSAELFQGSLETNTLAASMPRFLTVLHEYAHVPFPDEGPEQKRLGDKETGTTVDEIKADILGPAVLPELLAKGGLQGTKEQWANAVIASALHMMSGEDPDSDYFINSTYDINDLFEKDIVIQTANGFTVKDNNYDAVYAVWKQNAAEVVSLYRDATMKEKTAAAWIKRRCKPGEKLQAALEKVKTLDVWE